MCSQVLKQVTESFQVLFFFFFCTYEMGRVVPNSKVRGYKEICFFHFSFLFLSLAQFILLFFLYLDENKTEFVCSQFTLRPEHQRLH